MRQRSTCSSVYETVKRSLHQQQGQRTWLGILKRHDASLWLQASLWWIKVLMHHWPHQETTNSNLIQRIMAVFIFIHDHPCPLINWQNIKDDKRNLTIWELINETRNTYLITPCITFTPTKKKKKGLDYFLLHAQSRHSICTVARLIIFHQLKEQLYSNLLHMLMNQLSDGIGNWSPKVLAE